MRIVSMVPSWTETLIDVNADIVGRTRFCIHPRDSVAKITPVGGTKNWNIEKIKELKPDLILMDQEENVKTMAGETDIPLHVTHVQSLSDLPRELRLLSEKTKIDRLLRMADRFEKISEKNFTRDPKDLPTVLQWIRRPSAPIKKIVYLIWKDPWMAVSQETFIGSMLGRFVGKDAVLNSPEKYPKISFDELDPSSTLLLFSSEPFPFAKKPSEISSLNFPSAIVDGEKWSWFGVRALRFLESVAYL
jgi:iron complex transport system substrate-binding protein